MKIRNPYLKLVLPVTICICIYFALQNIAVLLGAGGKLMHILRPFLMGGVTAYLLAPICEWIEQFLKKHVLKKAADPEKLEKRTRGIAVLISVLLMLVISYLFMAMLIPQLVSSLSMLVSALPGYADAMLLWLDEKLQSVPELKAPIESYLENATSDSGALIETVVLPYLWTLMGGLGQTLGVLKDALIGLFAAIYILLERKNFRLQGSALIRALFRGERRNVLLQQEQPAPEHASAGSDVEKNIEAVEGVSFETTPEAAGIVKETTGDMLLREIGVFNSFMTGFIKGKLIDSLIIGILCGIFTVLTGMPYAALVSVIVGVTNIIPFFGPYFGAIPSALLILMVSPFHCAVFVVFIIILQQFDGNILGPKILGDTTNLSAFWILFSIILFGGLFGVPGMIVGVPVFGFAGHLLKEWISKCLAVSPNNRK